MVADPIWINAGKNGSVGTATIAAATDEFTITAHDLANGETVTVDTLTDGAVGVLVVDAVYFVRDVTANMFRVSLTLNGPFVDFASDGGAVVYRFAPQYNAAELRRAEAGLMFGGTTDAFGARQGVRPGHTPVSLSGTTWTVEDLTGAVYPGLTSLSGPYRVQHQAESGSLDPADGTNDRIDALDLQIQDDDEDASGFRRARVVYAVGTPGATPSPPTATVNSVRLATVLVPSGGTPSPSLTIVAPFTVAAGGVLPVRDDTERPGAGRYQGMLAYRQDLDELEAWDGAAWRTIAQPDSGRIATTIRTTNTSSFTAESGINDVTGNLIAGRTYRVRWVADIAGSVAGDNARVRIREDDAAGPVRALANVHLPTKARDFPFVLEAEYTPSVDETKNFRVTIQRIDGTGTVAVNANANEPMFLYIDYIRG